MYDVCVRHNGRWHVMSTVKSASAGVKMLADAGISGPDCCVAQVGGPTSEAARASESEEPPIRGRACGPARHAYNRSNAARVSGQEGTVHMKVEYTVLCYVAGVRDEDRCSCAPSITDAVLIAREYRAKWPSESIRITTEEYFESGEMPS